MDIQRRLSGAEGLQHGRTQDCLKCLFFNDGLLRFWNAETSRLSPPPQLEDVKDCASVEETDWTSMAIAKIFIYHVNVGTIKI